MEAKVRCIEILKFSRSVEHNWETLSLPVCFIFISKHLANDVFFSFLTLHTIKILPEYVAHLGLGKNKLFCKRWSCHLYCTVKEKDDHCAGGHRAFTHIGSQSTLHPVTNFAQVFEWSKVKPCLVQQSADKVLIQSLLLNEREPYHSIYRSDEMESLVVIALLCSVLSLSDEGPCFPPILLNLIGTTLSAISLLNNTWHFGTSIFKPWVVNY